MIPPENGERYGFWFSGAFLKLNFFIYLLSSTKRKLDKLKKRYTDNENYKSIFFSRQFF